MIGVRVGYHIVKWAMRNTYRVNYPVSGIILVLKRWGSMGALTQTIFCNYIPP